MMHGGRCSLGIRSAAQRTDGGDQRGAACCHPVGIVRCDAADRDHWDRDSSADLLECVQADHGVGILFALRREYRTESDQVSTVPARCQRLLEIVGGHSDAQASAQSGTRLGEGLICLAQVHPGRAELGRQIDVVVDHEWNTARSAGRQHPACESLEVGRCEAFGTQLQHCASAVQNRLCDDQRVAPDAEVRVHDRVQSASFNDVDHAEP
jgi:hypothetical protein